MKSRLGEKLAYVLRHCDGLQASLHDGRVEIDLLTSCHGSTPTGLGDWKLSRAGSWKGDYRLSGLPALRKRAW